jgi:hypothetical protein
MASLSGASNWGSPGDEGTMTPRTNDTASHPSRRERSRQFPHEGNAIVPAHTTKAYGGSSSMAALILNLGIRCR